MQAVFVFSLNERVGNQNKHINGYLYIAERLVKGKIEDFLLREVLFGMPSEKILSNSEAVYSLQPFMDLRPTRKT